MAGLLYDLSPIVQLQIRTHNNFLESMQNRFAVCSFQGNVMCWSRIMNYFQFRNKLSELRDDVQRMGGEVSSFQIGEPAEERTIQDIEKVLKLSLPEDMKAFFSQIAAHVDFDYSISWKDLFRGVEFSKEEGERLFSGTLKWNLRNLPSYRKDQRSQVKSLRDQRTKKYIIQSWLHSLIFSPIFNGDALAVDMSSAEKMRGKVIYLDHECTEHHDTVIANNFTQYVCNAIELYCVGPEIWSIVEFLDGYDGGLATNSAAAGKLKHWWEAGKESQVST